MQQNKLYVGNLPYTVDDAQLRELFSVYGEVQDIALIIDRETGRSKGFAFVTFGSDEAATKALEQNGKDLGGRPLKVTIAEERERKSRGDFGDGGGGGPKRDNFGPNKRKGGGGGRRDNRDSNRGERYDRY
jgi:RNA recognition motif-containing protein